MLLIGEALKISQVLNSYQNCRIKGPYENISLAYRKFAHWLELHPEYRMGGPKRQICHISPLNTEMDRYKNLIFER